MYCWYYVSQQELQLHSDSANLIKDIQFIYEHKGQSCFLEWKRFSYIQPLSLIGNTSSKAI